MEKRRLIGTSFWDKISQYNLTPNEKLLYVYLQTSPYSSLLGIYKIGKHIMSFHTGLSLEDIGQALSALDEKALCFYIDGHVILPDFLKYQRLNTNMKIGVVKLFNALPRKVKSIITGTPDRLPFKITFEYILSRMELFKRAQLLDMADPMINIWMTLKMSHKRQYEEVF